MASEKLTRRSTEARTGTIPLLTRVMRHGDGHNYWILRVVPYAIATLSGMLP